MSVSYQRPSLWLPVLWVPAKLGRSIYMVCPKISFFLGWLGTWGLHRTCGAKISTTMIISTVVVGNIKQRLTGAPIKIKAHDPSQPRPKLSNLLGENPGPGQWFYPRPCQKLSIYRGHGRGHTSTITTTQTKLKTTKPNTRTMVKETFCCNYGKNYELY